MPATSWSSAAASSPRPTGYRWRSWAWRRTSPQEPPWRRSWPGSGRTYAPRTTRLHRVDLYEHQARDMFEAHGVPVLRGITATTPEQARTAAAELGTPVVVVKAQVKTGGRGKAGGGHIARSPGEAAELAAAILGIDNNGHQVRTEMLAEGAQIDQ